MSVEAWASMNASRGGKMAVAVSRPQCPREVSRTGYAVAAGKIWGDIIAGAICFPFLVVESQTHPQRD